MDKHREDLSQLSLEHHQGAEYRVQVQEACLTEPELLGSAAKNLLTLRLADS